MAHRGLAPELQILTDSSDTVVTVLLDSSHDRQTFANTGPGLMTLTETAQILGMVTGTQVSFHEETIEEAWESRRPPPSPLKGTSPVWSAPTWPAPGELAVVADTVAPLTGHPA